MTTIYADIAESILAALPDFTILSTTAPTVYRPSGDGITTAPTFASIGAKTLYVVRASLAKLMQALPGVPTFASDFLIFGAASVGVQAGDVVTDSAIAFLVAGAPITDLGFLLAPAESAAVPS